VLAQIYNFTPSQIADMTPLQQMVLLGGDISDKIKFKTEQDFLKWSQMKHG